MDWHGHAAHLAGSVVHPASRWHRPLATTPRHQFAPCWWEQDGDGWAVRDGTADPGAWLDAAYSDTTLVTQVAGRHADLAGPGERRHGQPTSSSTLPGLVVKLLRYAHLQPGDRILDVGTGSGYGAALIAARCGDRDLTTVDVDPYLSDTARTRLAGIGLHPRVLAADATEALPDRYDRIVSTVAVRPVPASWVAALRPGGRIVTTITDTRVIVTADRQPDGGVLGRVERDWAGFMRARTRPGDYPPGLAARFEQIRGLDGDSVALGRYPVVDVQEAWELHTMLSITCPGIEHRFEQDADGRRTAWMVHPDGSWACASAKRPADRPRVRQAGPRRLWDELDAVRERWLVDGSLPVYGATVLIEPDGVIRLRRGQWSATIT